MECKWWYFNERDEVYCGIKDCPCYDIEDENCPAYDPVEEDE